MNQPTVSRSATRHGCHPDDAVHAYRHSIRVWQLDEGMEMHIGPSFSGELLEVGVVLGGGAPRIVHAMPARAKFLAGW